MDKDVQAPHKPLRELIESVELEWRLGDRESFESSVHALIASLKEDEYELKLLEKDKPFTVKCNNLEALKCAV